MPAKIYLTDKEQRKLKRLLHSYPLSYQDVINEMGYGYGVVTRYASEWYPGFVHAKGNDARSLAKRGRNNPMFGKTGDRHPNWKGGYITSQGYLRLGDQGLAHVVVMKNFIKGPLPQGHDVHHIDFNKLNNDISNLRLMSHADHLRLHALASGLGT